VEKYGTGIQRILQEFEAYNLPMPKFEEISEGFRVTAYGSVVATAQAEETPQVTSEIERVLAVCLMPKSRVELQRELGLSDKKHFRLAYLDPALKAGFIELTSPEKPRSRFQRYRLTEKGRSVLMLTKQRG
jgi:ATP-dependent DNA helicase RecG